MKKILLIISFFILSINLIKPDTTINIANLNIDINKNLISKTQTKKNKLLILYLKGGNGHIEACNKFKECFPDFEIKEINPVLMFFNNKIDFEKHYISIFQKGWTGTLNFVANYLGTLFFKASSRFFKKKLIKMLEEEKPDLLISVMPFINYPAIQAAQALNIPFLLMTLDADLTNWLLDMEKIKNKNFIITVPIMTDRIKKQLSKKNIPDPAIQEVGFHLREDFLMPKNLVEIRKEWNIPENKPVIMLMRGGTGSTRLVNYAQELVKINKDIHVLVCIGTDKTLEKKINAIKTDGHVSFSVIPFTKKISDLMAVSDLLITQPSPTVCNEAMFMNLPILIDLAANCFSWEVATIDWIKARGHGDVFTHMNQLNKLVLEYLDKKDFFKSQPSTTNIIFKEQIQSIISQILEH
ncbi:MAG: hypothetical protein WC436_00300 [Candidatus Babeliales bacterium]